MRRMTIGILTVAVFVGGTAVFAQFKPQDVAEDKKWEEFLATAEIKEAQQYESREAVTRPYRLILEKDGIRKSAVWKNAKGRMGGYLESWESEIAAYRLDRFLGLNMVPVAIERRYQENRGAITIWADSKMPYKAMIDDPRIKVPGGLTLVKFNRATYLQRAFDNLIANEDRHGNNILITEDWRILLIDHSRSFRSTKKFTASLLYTEKHREGPKLMLALPRDFVEKLKSLTAESLKAVTGEYLTDEAVAAVLKRRDLILKEIDRLVQKNGEGQTLY